MIVGRCTTYVGATRAIETTYDGKYLDHIMIESTMKGENGGYNHVGYSEYLKVYSHCPTGTELIAYSPETKSKMKSYNVGLSVNSDKSVGLSASTTVTKNSLEIDNNCNKAIRKFEIGYDYLHATWRFSWKTFDKYAYEENMQRAHFTMKTSKSKYYIGIFVKPKFQIYSSTPSFNACDRPYYVEKEDKVTFYMPY